MRFNPILFLLIGLWAAPASAQTDSAKAPGTQSFIFLPDGYHIASFKAHIDEPRVGLFKSMDASGMKVDVGNSIDLFQFTDLIPTWNLTAGIDFFAYAFVKSTQGLRLQIDAIDGFFGGNLAGSKPLNPGTIEVRLRILHHSAHLVDGHWNNGSWMDNMEPIAFTKDYGELVVAHKLTMQQERIRYYIGTSYATLIRPSEIKRIDGLLGFECSTSRILGSFLHHPVTPFVAYNMQLSGMPTYSASHYVQLGIKFGEWEKKGINFFLGYYSGRHMFAEYYNRQLQTFGMGFSVDFE